MNPLLLLRLAWADALERVRRSSFLLTVGTTVWLGSLVYTDNIQMWIGEFRGAVNSAWIGTVMALSATTFASLAGFYIVKNAVDRDRRTGVGQILAATRVTTAGYLLAKWLSNSAVLGAIVLTLMGAALVLHVVQARNVPLDVVALLAPLVFLALPAMAAVAACAVVFETVPLLSGGFGNAAYFFLWSAALTAPLATQAGWADWSGISVVESSLAAAVRAVAPGAELGLSFTAGPTKDLSHLTVVDWTGIRWTLSVVGLRLAWIAASVVAAAGAALWFDRFDTVRTTAAPRQRTGRVRTRVHAGRETSRRQALRATAWTIADRLVSSRSRRGAMVVAELRLALSEVSGWWLAIAAGLWLAGLLTPMPAARYVHVVAWLWPLVVWSTMGVRETLHRTGAFVFSSPQPLGGQFVSLWISGVVIAVVTGSALAVRFVALGDWASLGAWGSGALFVPAFALALGVWTGSARPFEALYTAWWYVGPANAVASLDFTGAWASRSPIPTALIYLALAGAFVAIAIQGQRRRIRA